MFVSCPWSWAEWAAQRTNNHVHGRTTMSRAKISEQEWQTFLDLADRLEIPVRRLLREDVRFTAMETAGHQLGRAVAQITTERLALERAERLTGPQPCPTCQRMCSLIHKERELETIDGPVGLREPVCHCPACRRDFFPSASGTGASSAEL